MQLVVEFADVRVLAFGVLNRTGSIFLNSNSHAFLHPAGIEGDTKSRHSDIKVGPGNFISRT